MKWRLLKRVWRVFTASPWETKAMVLAQEGMCNRIYARIDENGGIVYEHPCDDDRCLWINAWYETINP